MRTVASNLRQAVGSWGFLLSLAGAALIPLLSSVQGILSAFRSAELLSPGYHSDLIMGALSSEAMALALPILAALPYTASFIDDVKSGFIKEYLPRTTVPRYIAGKAWAAPFQAGLRWRLAYWRHTALPRSCSCPWRHFQSPVKPYRITLATCCKPP